MMTTAAWFDGIDVDDLEAATQRLKEGTASAPDQWPDIAVVTGTFRDPSTYYARLNEVARAAVNEALESFAQEADRELVHLIRTHDAISELANELDQRLVEVTSERDTLGVGDEGTLRSSIDRLETISTDLDGEVEEIERAIRRHAVSVAPNLSTLAGPMLAARLIEQAGSLKDLARMSSSTVQVLGAESALFAHLRGEATSPKHGIIYMHPAVRSAPSDDRGRIARSLAGKLSIAARIDAYRGELEPELEEEWIARLERIRGEVDA